MMRIGAVLYIIFFLTGFNLPDDNWITIDMQEYDKIITKAESFFKNNSYAMTYKMQSFKSHAENVPHDTQTGKTIISGKNYYSNFLGIKTVQNKSYKLLIDSIEKSILITNPIDQSEYKPLIENYKIFKTNFSSIKKLNTITGSKIEMLFKEKLKIKKIILELDKDGLITKTVSFLNISVSDNPMNKNAVKSKPRIETSFFNYKKNEKYDYKTYFDESKYISIKNGKVTPTEKFKNFRINDTRIKR